MADMSQAPLSLLDDLLKRAKAKGADAADAVFVRDVSLAVAERLGKREKLERSESQDIGLRVFIGHRQAMVSSSDFSSATRDELAARAVAMARAVPVDECCGLAGEEEITRGIAKVDIFDPIEPDEAQLTALVRKAEDAARAVHGVTNSEGAEAGWGRVEIALAATNGFNGEYCSSRHALSVSVLAGEGTGMERDYDHASTVYGADLPDASLIGRSAGERAVKRLNPRKVQTAQVPIIFDPRVSNSLVGHFAGAINGASIARGTSFLKDRMGKPVFPRGIEIIDDPLRPRGLRSRPFDGEGIGNRRRALVQDGTLQSWVLDCRSARQLGLKTTGHAARGTSSAPSPSVSNLYMAAGSLSPAALMANIKAGFYVTELIGSGVNGITGDYSRGAVGFWIENGILAHAVSEVTIAGNLKDMFLALTPADDLIFRHGIDAPTLRIDGMTLAGE